jgi:FeS assembly SUF system regulator
MLRISKLTDYGTLVLSTMANAPQTQFSASELAQKSGLNTATVSKLLKSLTRADLLVSQRGARGGYQLAKNIEQISALEIIRALEGPVALTECSTDHNECEIADACQMQSKWQIINFAIRRALSELSLADLSKPIQQKININLSAAIAEFNNTQDLTDPIVETTQ